MTEKMIRYLQYEADGSLPALQKLFAVFNLNLSKIAFDGVLCLDVGEGREIIALHRLNPRHIVTTEQNTPYPGCGQKDALLQEVIATNHLTELQRGPALDLLGKMTKKFGLITWLNVFPSLVTGKNAYLFFEKSMKLLTAGGVAIMSFDYPRPEGNFGIEALTNTWLFCQENYQKCRLHLPENEKEYMSSNGGVFLLVEALPGSKAIPG